MRLSLLVAIAMAVITPCLAARPPPKLDDELLKALPFDADWGAAARVYEMPCPTCRIGPSDPLDNLPLTGPQPGEVFPESILRVNISVEQTNDQDALLINGCQFYPSPTLCSSSTVRADQYVKSECGTWEYKASPYTAFRSTREHTNDNVLGRGIAANVFRLWIGRVATRLIKPEPEINVRLLIFPNGQLLIATGAAYVPTSPKSTCESQPPQPQSSCNSTTSPNATGVCAVVPSHPPGINGAASAVVGTLGALVVLVWGGVYFF
ncbi:hypothetical protein VHEMI10278 [[Torrubiella] hemipterigena]|uniref:DUF7728 domain-containing protein n=1 Tax=[Torrubiella] hemipterigena TaxID=1531966 RepID=A0A0A1TRL9_9HYPO|nr:hypothetical protein VHEMI10278 [[Torrubiella] hemipterigena]